MNTDHHAADGGTVELTPSQRATLERTYRVICHCAGRLLVRDDAGGPTCARCGCRLHFRRRVERAVDEERAP